MFELVIIACFVGHLSCTEIKAEELLFPTEKACKDKAPEILNIVAEIVEKHEFNAFLDSKCLPADRQSI